MGILIGESNLSRIAIGYAIDLANLILFLLAYTLGNTSPNNKSKRSQELLVNFKTGEATEERLPHKENKITI
jgi:hypothetical protein